MTDVRLQIIAYVFVSIVLWMVATQLTRRRSAIPWIRLLSQGRAASILRFAYYVGLPYVVLILGVVPGRYLGLAGLDRLEAEESSQTGFEIVPNGWHILSHIRDDVSLVILDWLPDVGTLAGLAAVMLLLLSITWLGYGFLRSSVNHGLRSNPPPLQGTENPSVARVAYQAIHWSFYRSAAWLLADDPYLGIIGGILLVGGEWMLDPEWKQRVGHAPSAEEPLIDASVLIATSVMFFFVPNLWLLIPIHWLLAMVSRRMVALGRWRMAHSH